MKGKILHSFLSVVLVVAASLSTANALSLVSATSYLERTSSPQNPSAVEGNWLVLAPRVATH